VPSKLVRIFSDLHYGDRATALHSLDELAPLFEGADEIVLNGDTLDTRPSAHPEQTAALRAQVADFFARSAPPSTFLTGNHDPDITGTHHLQFAQERVFLTHGDSLFEDLVPWSQDAPIARRLVARELAALPRANGPQLDAELAAYRRAAAALPQRHQSESHGLKYLIGFVQDTVWPPARIFRVLRAWREAPRRAGAFVQRHQLGASFFAMGHTHRLGAVRLPSGLVVLNTGSFCPPCSAGGIEFDDTRIALRRVEKRRGAWRFGGTLAEFALADA
jgi:predicted phosphodiesterase